MVPAVEVAAALGSAAVAITLIICVTCAFVMTKR
jgi:hypothetical protein